MSLSLTTYQFKTMGGPAQLKIYTAKDATSKSVYQAVMQEVSRLEKKYSRYLSSSVTSAINQSAGNNKGIRVDEETTALLNFADTAYQNSDGLFDITSGTLRHAWDFSSNQLPKQESINKLLKNIGWHQVKWQPPYLYLPRQGFEIDFGGFVKEYAVDKAAALCQQLGIQHGLLELAGDLKIIGPHPDNLPWAIGIQHPRQQQAIASIHLHEGALATSGDYERFMLINEKRYCHILNPKTGYSTESFAGVSIVTEQCLIAGVLATIAMLKTEKKSLAWLQQQQVNYLAINQQCEVKGDLINK